MGSRQPRPPVQKLALTPEEGRRLRRIWNRLGPKAAVQRLGVSAVTVKNLLSGGRVVWLTRGLVIQRMQTIEREEAET